MRNISIFGMILSGLYLALSVHLILTQGLFGESFIAIWLGMPWSLLLVYISELFATSLPFPFGIYGYVLSPIILNIIILYFIGKMLGNMQNRMKNEN